MNVDENEELKPLTTLKFISREMLESRMNAGDIPKDARLTLKFDRKNGRFYLLFYWSEGPAVLGERVVDFDLESKDLCGDAWNWMEDD